MVLLVRVWPVSCFNRKYINTGQKTALVKQFHGNFVVDPDMFSVVFLKCSTGKAFRSHPLCASLCWSLTPFLPTAHRHRMKSSRNNKTEDQQRSSTLGSCLLSAALYLPLWRLFYLTLFFYICTLIFKDSSMWGSLWQLLARVCMFSDRLCDFSWNKLCLTRRSVLVQRLEERCVCVWIQRDVLKHWLVSCARAVVFTCWHLPSPFTHTLVHWP